MNRAAITRARNSPVAMLVRETRNFDLKKRSVEIENLNREFGNIVLDRLREKNKMERSYQSLSMGKESIVIEMQKKQKLKNLKQTFKGQASEIL